MLTCFTRKAPQADQVVPIRICRPDTVQETLDALSPQQATFARARGFEGASGARLILPNATGDIDLVLFGAGDQDALDAGPLTTGLLAARLPQGVYEFSDMPEDWDPALAAIGWGLGAYKFDRYLPEAHVPPVLLLSEGHAPDETECLVAAIHRGRDLVNTPAGDMGCQALHDAAQSLADTHGADISAVIGEDLLEKNYPMIHAVGRAGPQPPRIVEFKWGDPLNPKLALIGKGITFDTGGVNMKSAAGARIMKKDMGGAAHALALADMIMSNKLPVRLHVLLAIAENSVASNAYRPGDVLQSRRGLTVEIDNTDAEGRLVLGDALTKAAEGEPDLMIDFATLTGAARVALGPVLPPFFCNRESYVKPVMKAAKAQGDPVWNMPLYQPYNAMLSSPLADMKNAGGSFAGCMTAALFLERFVGQRPWMHFDVYAWNPSTGPHRPKGGEIMVARTLYHFIKSGGITRV